MSAIEDRVRRKVRSVQRKTPEADIQRELVALLRLHRVPVFHCPNESNVPVQYRAKLASLGLARGVPDLVIVRPIFLDGHWYPGAALELKAPGGTPSDEQLVWLGHFATSGFLTAVAVGREQALAQLRAWGLVP